MTVFHVSDFGQVLATRPNGVKVAEALKRVAEQNDGGIEVNFEGCEVASVPFMQELLRECRRLGDRIIYSCLNEDVHATLSYVESTQTRPNPLPGEERR